MTAGINLRDQIYDWNQNSHSTAQMAARKAGVVKRLAESEVTPAISCISAEITPNSFLLLDKEAASNL